MSLIPNCSALHLRGAHRSCCILATSSDGGSAGARTPALRPRKSSGVLRAHPEGGEIATDDSTSDTEDVRPTSYVRELPSSFTVLARDGKWRIRQIDRDNLDEVRRVVLIQAEGFHIPNPLPFVDGFLKTSFTAEVLSEMQKKLKYNPLDKFVCLVVERTDKNNGRERGETVVEGVVEVSYIDEKEVLASLEPGTPGVVYVASMAVAPSARRQGAAKALLDGAVEVTKEWREEKAVLHVYQDNEPAVRLYSDAGFETIFQDSPLWAKVGVRPRFLMRKEC